MMTPWGNDTGFGAGQKVWLMKTYVQGRRKNYFKSMPPRVNT